MLQVVKKEKPGVIVIVDEYGLYGRAATIAGKINNIPTLAIQHGALTPNDLGWLHLSDEISNNFIDPKYCPIPDKTAVSGEYYKNILTRLGSYPKDRVIITGQPKYDILAHANNFFEKRKIYDKFKVEYKKKLVVLATQPLPENENELLFRSVFREIKKLKDIQLVIKLHPNEYDESLHRNIAKEVGLDVILTKDINLFELLNACDVLMTVSSTVALEAMILDKPVIIVDLKTNPDETAFVKSGAAIGVYKSNDINKAIIKILNDKGTKKKLQNNMKKFVYEHAYRIDGLAYKRIVKLINEMINKSS
jgi:UDP-N-acetylglucosamine 2-epimerase